MHRSLIYTCLFALLSNCTALGWEAVHYTDTQVVQRAETIVIGHIKSGSIEVTQYPGDYISRAILIVTTVIKGDTKNREIPIILNYGLLPVPDRLKDKVDGVDDILKKLPQALNEKGPVLLFEDNPSEGCTKISDDILQDQIWLLRQGKRDVSQVPSSSGLIGSFQDVTVSGLGVWDPQDVQPLTKTQDLTELVK